MIRAMLAVLVTAGVVWAGVLTTQPPAPVAEACAPGVPVSMDGTCGLSWDDIRDQPVHTMQETP